MGGPYSKSGMSAELTEHEGRLETLEAASLEIYQQLDRTRLNFFFILVVLLVIIAIEPVVLVYFFRGGF